MLGDTTSASQPGFPDNTWRSLNLPHDWSVEGTFAESNPAGVGGGALPGGIGWYRKTFSLTPADQGKQLYLAFDGVYRNSEVWINGQLLGKRPNGYISFQYDITPHVKYDAPNVVAVRVDNGQQPNSRWYSGSGIYRHVWLISTGQVHIDQWGTYIQTPEVSAEKAIVSLEATVRNTTAEAKPVTIETIVYNALGDDVDRQEATLTLPANSTQNLQQQFVVKNPALWTLDKPTLYKAVTTVHAGNKLNDRYETTFGIRTFSFDSARGFALNGQPVKINGVCNHHDLGCLGSAINERALERQLEILKSMGVNGIRTSHNPPAPELLNLCDRMGFIVMDEMFDMWKLEKTKYDYSLDWDQWHERDLRDFIRRDRNHPSVIIWSVGNEIREQWDSTGIAITRELAGIVRSLDKTRPITTANNETQPHNFLIRSGALDLIGFNYHHQQFADFPKTYPGQKWIGTETVSALQTRGHYDMPSDSIRRWPTAWDKPFNEGNADFTVSAYDNVSAPWGSTHEETWKVMKKHDFLSGMFIWTGFDYLGEPTPYGWPARSSFFGIVDLAGFPKDVYYMYQSEWTNTPVLHVFPHWNWKAGQTIDLWAYYNQADEVELYINGKSQGVRRKTGDDLHVMWRVAFEPGTVKAVSRKDGKEVLVKEVHTADAPAKVVLEADRATINADGRDLSFITVKVLDAQGNIVPDAENLVQFTLEGEADIAGVDNGNPISHESFKAPQRKAFHGLCLLVVKSRQQAGTVKVNASAEGLPPASLTLTLK